MSNQERGKKMLFIVENERKPREINERLIILLMLAHLILCISFVLINIILKEINSFLSNIKEFMENVKDIINLFNEMMYS